MGVEEAQQAKLRTIVFSAVGISPVRSPLITVVACSCSWLMRRWQSPTTSPWFGSRTVRSKQWQQISMSFKYELNCSKKIRQRI
jgi:hypothetical protein